MRAHASMLTLFRAIFAFDRLFRRTPSIIEIWFLEFLTLIPLGLAFGSWLDGVGALGCPPAGFGIDGSSIGIALFGLLMGFFAVRRILRPKVLNVSWTPVHALKGVAPVPIPVPQRSGTVEYQVLSSHPSYAFVNVLTLPIAAVGLFATDSCATSFFPLFGLTTLVLMAVLIILRLVSWYVLRLGRDELERNAPAGMTPAQAEWALAWQPMIAMMALIGGCLAVVFGIVWLRVLLGYGL
jgi:hypothetical protein